MGKVKFLVSLFLVFAVFVLPAFAGGTMPPNPMSKFFWPPKQENRQTPPQDARNGGDRDGKEPLPDLIKDLKSIKRLLAEYRKWLQEELGKTKNLPLPAKENISSPSRVRGVKSQGGEFLLLKQELSRKGQL
ncbi:MAG: hypothetical protein IMW94_04445 [Thermoanaerobacter sp.]|nr:hypothetical protein [Thermoanaerobacter sp.]